MSTVSFLGQLNSGILYLRFSWTYYLNGLNPELTDIC